MPSPDEIIQADLEKEFESFGEAERRILRAAVIVFAEKGYDGARTEEIAVRAGVNKAMIHYYFKSKENLYVTIIESLFNEISLILGTHLSMIDANAPEQGISSFVDEYIEFIYTHRIFIKVLKWEFARGDAIVPRVVGNVLRTHTERILKIFRGAARDGHLRPIDPRQLFVSIMGMILFFFIAEPVIRVVWGEDPMTRKHIEARKREITDLIIHGILPKQG